MGSGRPVGVAAQAGRAVGHLLVHVGHVQAGDLADVAEDGDGVLGLVGVHVHAQGALVAHHQHAVAQALERRHERLALQAHAGHGEVGAVAEGRGAVLGQVVALHRGAAVGQLGRVAAAQGGHHAGDDDGQAVGAGVHDAGLLEHVQLLGAALDGLVGGVQRPLQDLGDELVLLLGRRLGAQPRRGDVGQVLGHAVGHGPHRAEHGALGRVAHRRVGGVGGAREGGGHQHRVHQLAGTRGQLLGRPAHDLGQDHAAVAAGAQQGGAGHGADQLLAADLVDHLAVEGVQLLEHGAHGHGHVVAGVAVGDGEHVQVVHLAPAALQLVQRGRHHAAEADQALVGHRRGSTPRAGLVSVRVPVGTPEYYAYFVTLSALRQRVQTYSREGEPFTSMRTFCRFGLKRRFVATIEWLRLCPNAGPFPQL